MITSLPAPVVIYFEASNGADTDGLYQCFHADATVRDEGRTYRGHDAIAKWCKAACEKFDFSVEPVSVLRDGTRLVVDTTVTGNFPGSPVQLDHTFELEGDRIRSLVIG